jgi:hypothetical protein
VFFVSLLWVFANESGAWIFSYQGAFCPYFLATSFVIWFFDFLGLRAFPRGLHLNFSGFIEAASGKAFGLPPCIRDCVLGFLLEQGFWLFFSRPRQGKSGLRRWRQKLLLPPLNSGWIRLGALKERQGGPSKAYVYSIRLLLALDEPRRL